MDNEKPRARPHAFAVKIHESLLRDGLSELQIPKEGFESRLEGSVVEGFKGVISRDTGGDDNLHSNSTQQTVEIQSKKAPEPAHLFTESATNTTSKLQWKAQLDRSLIIKPTDEIKDLGKKAKARLEEEKSKRPEIVVLESSEAPPEAATNADKATFVPPKAAKASSTRKRKITTTGRSSKKSKRRDIDLWVPDVSNLGPVDKDVRSNIVQLHGLPEGCKVEQIRKFFKGLETERVFVLLSNRTVIASLDSSTDIPATPAITRHGNDLRVFVKFGSAPTAALAIERSGETIIVEDHPSGMKGAAIIVTYVEKRLGQALLKTLAIDGISQKTLSETLIMTEVKLHPMVRKILWSFLSRQFQIPVDQGIHDASLVLDERKPAPLTSLEGYRKVAIHHNKLVDLYNELLLQTPFPSTGVIETELSSIAPTVRLTNAAINLLDEEIDRLDNKLHQARLRVKIQHNNGGASNG